MGTVCVALFRGINVGKAKRIAMADLRELLLEMGYQNVSTLLNSGNAIFEVKGRAKHAERIRTAVREHLGVDAQVIVKTRAEIAAAVAELPLPEQAAADPSRLLVAFCEGAAGLVALQPLAAQAVGEERFCVGASAAYLWCANGILESRLPESLLKMTGNTGTTRNWATLLKIHQTLSA
ncbi:DUF1697 domain-containing protein [Pelomonas sp. V22]|uniref:DUF1697 domain-containing protein n=1 Tax=Pelomonas sp. V22 TaxID=2822139 RepID=UPI0024A96F19|nr:DUF1697 domain-containing protein [Pelomonas sp. V22]MDI4634484.1 DUF1697 domain-containing protein [Pelomonas sp. V22]